MLSAYPALFIQEDLGYSVIFPDLPGCQTEGDSMDEALTMSKEALEIYISSLLERKINIPAPSNPLEITTKEKEFVVIITADRIAEPIIRRARNKEIFHGNTQHT